MIQAGAARPGGLGEGTLLLLWKIWSQLSPILGENIFKFTPILGENLSQISPILGENIPENVFLTLSPIFKNTPLLLSPLRTAPGFK